MNTIFLCLVMVGQVNINGLPYPALDFAFIEAQELSVIGFAPAGRGDIVKGVPPDIVVHLIGMGHDYYKIRDKHKAALLKMGPSVSPWLIHGFYLGDPEIRMRCENLLCELSRCPICEGRGGEDGGQWEPMNCSACRGVGHYWPLSAFPVFLR